MDRILNMLLRLFLRRGVNMALRKGTDMLGRRATGKGGTADPRRAKRSREDARRIRQMMRVARRITRF